MAAADRLAATTLELPAELPLGADSQVAIELDHAELQLTSRVDGLPVLRARLAAAGESAGLEAISEGGSLTVRRLEGGEATRLRLDLMLGPGRTVRVAGSELTVRVDDPAGAPEDGWGRSSFHLALERSRVELSGARVGRLDLTASSLLLSDSTGSFALTLAGGSADLRRHRGSLDLAATDAEVTVVDHRGPIAPRIDGGSLKVTGGAGTFAGTAGGALLVFNAWQGPVELRATGTSVDARGAEDDRSQWRLAGRDLQVLLESIRGPVAVDLQGGSLLGNGLRELQATAGAAARLELAEVSGSVVLELSGGADAYLTGVGGSLEAAVTDSRLEAERIGQLALTGAGGEVEVRGVERLTSLDISDSELLLDLRRIRQAPSLALRGSTVARVLMKAPCIVEGAGDRVEAIDCEVEPPGQRLTPRQQRLRYGDRRPTRLTVTVGPDVALVVEGLDDGS